MAEKATVTFEPEMKTIEVTPGTTILKAAGMLGLGVISPCGGNGICGKCRVRVLSGSVEGEPQADGYYLGCVTKIKSDVTVEIPKSARNVRNKILERGRQRPLILKTSVRKTYLELELPSLEDQRADFERIRDAVEQKQQNRIYAHGEVLTAIPGVLRASDFKVTVVTDRRELIAIEPGDTTQQHYGVAVDIGTTTVAGLLVNLLSGEILASASRTNPQSRHGDDVIARIDFSESEGGLEILSKEINLCLQEIIEELSRKARIESSMIYEVAVAGNTTMNHLFHRIPCSNIARAPYIPVFRGGVNIKSQNTDLKIHPHGNIYLLPNIAGYVGADISAGILAAGMHESDEMQLLVDIGTNGEIALGNKNRILVCSTAAGPAFEGARIKFGMRGADGAIEKVMLNNDVYFSVIGNTEPQGICGTGVIDLVAELVKLKVVDETGRLLSANELNSHVSVAIKSRIQSGENGNQFLLAERPDHRPIIFTQRDIREVQLAKAAIYAGIQVLLGAFSMSFQDLDAVLLAGAFGNYIRPSQAKVIGLLPNVPETKIKFIGNAAIEGALRALLSTDERDTVEKIAARTEYIELSARPDFQEHYMLAMLFGLDE
jgi:uncharacterized 2Fe-2S/4Fe-4S cluster protein (DUF4445 family)